MKSSSIGSNINWSTMRLQLQANYDTNNQAKKLNKNKRL